MHLDFGITTQCLKTNKKSLKSCISTWLFCFQTLKLINFSSLDYDCLRIQRPWQSWNYRSIRQLCKLSYDDKLSQKPRIWGVFRYSCSYNPSKMQSWELGPELPKALTKHSSVSKFNLCDWWVEWSVVKFAQSTNI